MSLEILDKDELEWVLSGLPALARISKVKTIVLTARSDGPKTVTEFEDFLQLRRQGSKVDGRLYQEKKVPAGMTVTSAWPPFAHWGKHKWMREMLLERSHTTEVRD